MELKPGYKQTEVGIIPREWDIDAIGCVALITTGNKNTQDRVEDGVYPFFVRSATIERINTFALDGEAVLTAGDGVGTGKVFHYIKGKFDFHQRVYCIHGFNNQLNGYYFYLYFSNHFFSRVMSMTAKSSVDSVRREMIADMKIPLPPLPEQRAIAAALSDTDALLSGLDTLIAKKRDIKQAVMQQLLTGNQRLPGFSGDWEMKRLGDFGKCLRGVSYKGDSDLSSHDTDTTIRLLRSNNVQGSTINIKDVQYVNCERVSEQQKMQANDVLICMANGSKELVGKAGVFKIADGHVYTFGAFMGCYRTDPEVAHPAYIFFLFQTNQYRDYINNLLAGSSINNLKPSSIESLVFQVPLLPEQTAIAAVLSDIDAEIAAVEQRRDKTTLIKQGMMQELLTGKTRLV